ncbi:MAG: hypothetical protein NZM35_11030 [Chitinophagales bacterium]|nr:hypothetical protein [Chitinophagales bacterium]MDW8419862.1 hypothetical protein [Chitinophagales bacterium]
MDINEDLYQSLHDDLEICRDYIKQVAMGMIKGGVSNYPIFVAVRGESDIDLGIPLIRRDDFDISWSFNVSHLEDFVNKGIIHRDKVNDFIKAYKNPVAYMCVFVAEEQQAGFVFMPYDRNREKLN